MRIFKASLMLIGSLCLSGCALFGPTDLYDIPLKPVPKVDLDRYMGRWYLMANIPYFAERGNLAPYVEYRRREDGLIEDRFTALRDFKKKRFVKMMEIEIFDPVSNAEGRITYKAYPGQDFAILYLDPQYRYTVIGHPSREYCWLFSREPDLPEKTYKKMLAVLKQNKFDISRVLRIPHLPEQIGLPGYQ